MRPSIEQLDEFHERSKGREPRFTRKNFQEYLRNPDKRSARFPSEIHAPELIPEGYQVVVDVEPSEFDLDAMEYVGFLEEKDGKQEEYVVGKVMRGRSVILEATFGLVDLKRFLAEPEKIQAEFRGKKVIIFTGTVLRGPDGCLLVAYLFWFGDEWALGFVWLDGNFVAISVLPRSKSGT